MLHGICENLQSFLQSYNKSLINKACSGPYWENIGPRSFSYGPRCAWSVLSRPRANILPVRPSRLVKKIYVAIAIAKLLLTIMQLKTALTAMTICYQQKKKSGPIAVGIVEGKTEKPS